MRDDQAGDGSDEMRPEKKKVSVLSFNVWLVLIVLASLLFTTFHGLKIYNALTTQSEKGLWTVFISSAKILGNWSLSAFAFWSIRFCRDLYVPLIEAGEAIEQAKAEFEAEERETANERMA